MDLRFTFATRAVAFFLGCVVVSWSWAQPAKGPVRYAISLAGGASLPFSEAVLRGDTLSVSGQVGSPPGTLILAPGGIRTEAKQANARMKAVLECDGSLLDRVVRRTAFVPPKEN